MQKSICLMAILGLAVAGCNPSSDRDSGASAPPAVTDRGEATGAAEGTTQQRDVDNTGVNVRDRSDATLTPMDQGGSEADREVTKNIRQVVTDDQYSADAKNIKIITVNGAVTLRGPVRDAQERQRIEAAIKAVPGVTAVDNQLEPKQTNQ